MISPSTRKDALQPSQAVRSPAPDLARGAMLAAIALANVMIYLYDRPYGLRHHIVEEGALDQAVTAVLTTTVDARAYPMSPRSTATVWPASPPPGPPAAGRTGRCGRCCVGAASG
ncbi:hypothetical protein [Pseudactinotalea suaedae]|uniref:hypothetical protein n=1 Tax=Pseudactinotalea suaedae TaxID=1524924 RepID=UPI0012E29995|nr:hypothetical protein [Pseudactinotalea suaedae]